MTEQLSDEANALVLEIARLVVESDDFQDDRWRSLTQIYNFADGAKSSYGYRYDAEEWEAAGPDSSDALRAVSRLRETMEKDSGTAWNWACLTIVAPAMKIAIDFGYDENPWAMGKKSLDMSDYAISVRSPDHPTSDGND